MNLFKSGLLTMLLFFSGLVSLSGQDATTDFEQAIDEIFKDFDNLQKPGAAVAVVQNGEIVFKKGYGSANLEYDIPVTPATIFHVASVSKQFTVFALLLLQEEGKLSLDDPIQKYIAETPDFEEEITLRHLATHTSGMRDQWDLLNLAGWRWDDVITKEHILKIVSQQKELNFVPGEQFMYCNTGFTLLAEVVARVSGYSFAEFTRRRIFSPLKMTNSQFYDDHQRIVKNRAYSYYPNGLFTFQKSVLSYANVGATSLFTTVEDLSLWAMNFKKLKVGSKAVVDQMNTLAVLNNGETFGGAYGQFVGPYRGLQQIQHSGGDAGYRSYLARFPEQDFAVSVVSNNGASNPGALALKVADIYLEDNFIEASEPKKKEKVSELTEKELKAFEGYYWDAKDLNSRKIELKEGSLLYDRGYGNTTELEEIGKNTFKMLNIPTTVTINFSSINGKNHMVVAEGDRILSNLEEYTPDVAEFSDVKQYVGSYSSDELSTTYILVEKNGKLVGTHYRRSDMILSFARTDIYKAGGNTIKFTRNASNTIDGFEFSSGRVKNLKFVKN